MNVLRMLIAVLVLLAVAPVLAEEAAKPAEAAAAARPPPPDCIRETGTRIQHREGECTGAPGRTISREDIDNSGATSVGDALRTLDPRVGLRR